MSRSPLSVTLEPLVRERGLSSRGLAALIDEAGIHVSHTSLSRIINGKHGAVSDRVLRGIAEVLPIEVEALRELAGPPPDPDRRLAREAREAEKASLRAATEQSLREAQEAAEAQTPPVLGHPALRRAQKEALNWLEITMDGEQKHRRWTEWFLLEGVYEDGEFFWDVKTPTFESCDEAVRSAQRWVEDAERSAQACDARAAKARTHDQRQNWAAKAEHHRGLADRLHLASKEHYPVRDRGLALPDKLGPDCPGAPSPKMLSTQ